MRAPRVPLLPSCRLCLGPHAGTMEVQSWELRFGEERVLLDQVMRAALCNARPELPMLDAWRPFLTFSSSRTLAPYAFGQNDRAGHAAFFDLFSSGAETRSVLSHFDIRILLTPSAGCS